MKRHSLTLLILVSTALAGAAIFISYAEPNSGNLTRIGAFSERNFGWHQAQQTNPKHTNTPTSKNKPHIWVAGDSFSRPGFWQAYLQNYYTFSFTHIEQLSHEKLFKQLAEKKPDFLVIQVSERLMIRHFLPPHNRFTYPDANCAPIEKRQGDANQIESRDNDFSNHTEFSALHQFTAKLPQFPAQQRDTHLTDVKQISQSRHIAETYFKNWLSPDSGQAKSFQLNRSDFFSNRLSNQLLIYHGDLLIHNYPSASSVQALQCNLERLSELLRQQGINFIFVGVADKSSVYAPYVIDERFQSRQALLNRLDLARIPEAIDLLPTKRAALQANIIDLYLPNDTHWGYAGHQLTAAAIHQKLQQLTK